MPEKSGMAAAFWVLSPAGPIVGTTSCPSAGDAAAAANIPNGIKSRNTFMLPSYSRFFCAHPLRAIIVHQRKAGTTNVTAPDMLGEALAGARKGMHTVPRHWRANMQSRFVAREAEAMADRYGARDVPRDLAMRVYTTRLLGGDPRLVLRGGGNTSVKLRLPDLMGREVDVL
jgi:hypothetical protein